MRNPFPWVIAALAVGLAGCGGGGGSSTRLGVYMTDSFRTDYDHVWATVYKVEAIATNGHTTTLYDNSAGKLVDLRSLHDATGSRFLFMADQSIPDDTWASFRVTTGPSMTLFAANATTGVATDLAASVPRDNAGHAQIMLNLATPRKLASHDDLVVDFDLAAFTISSGKIVPSLKEGATATLGDSSRHENDDYTGIVSNLAGTPPLLTFNLIRGEQVTKVGMTSTTTVYNSSSQASPAIVNGQWVEIRGKFDTALNQLVAIAVKIEGASESVTPEIKGATSTPNATAGTFKVTTHEVHGFIPAATMANVTTTANTVYRSDSGLTLTAATFFGLLATSRFVEVEGVYTATSNTIAATRIKVDDIEEAGGSASADAMAKGTTTNISTFAGTFTLSALSEFEGFMLVNNVVNVATSATTVYKAKNGTAMTSVDFFAGLTTTTQVRVDGTYSNGVLTAKTLQLL